MHESNCRSDAEESAGKSTAQTRTNERARDMIDLLLNGRSDADVLMRPFASHPGAAWTSSGHNPPVEVTFQFPLVVCPVSELSGRYAAVKLMNPLPQPGQ
jgi:hypothetical protein